LMTVLVIIAAFALGVILSRFQSTPRPSAPPTNTPRAVAQAATTRAPVTPPTAPATLTPSRTLRPPPTFEPPTATVLPSGTPTITLSPTVDLAIDIPGLRGGESPTPTTTPGCELRKDWKLTYTVQRNDAMIRIAEAYNTTVDALLKANCLRDPNVIRVGQVLKVPGTAHPVTPDYVCSEFLQQTPINGTLGIPGDGTLTFNWRGPRVDHYLLRIHRPDGSIYESVTDLRQNDVVNLPRDLAAAGTYRWYAYPLDRNYRQVCPEGGPWYFTKAISPTLTPTFTSGGGGGVPTP
jgi:LysM repeat protein